MLLFCYMDYKKQKMKLKLVDRKYIIGGRIFRFCKMKGIKLIGWKIAIGRYELRLYLT